MTTIRPSATSSALGWSAVPSGTLHGVTSDNSDSTYALWSGSGAGMVLTMPPSSPPPGERRHQVRARVRGRDGDSWWSVIVSSGALVGGSSAQFSAIEQTVSGSWGFGMPPDGSTALSAYITGQSGSLDVLEVYVDVDSRVAPTFTAQVLDGSGASTTTVVDTTTPSLVASSIDLDDLSPRQYRYWVTQGATIVWDTGIVSGPSVARVTAPLENGSYDAHLQIWTTLGSNNAYASDEETVSFTVSVGTVPAPENPVVTPVTDSPFYSLEVCASDVSDFDGAVGYVEIQRVDCDGSVSVAILGPLETDECATYIDYSFPRTGMGATCDHDPEPCCSYYRARTLGRIDDLLHTSLWSDAEPPVPTVFCLEWGDDEHLIRTTGPDGPLWAPVLGKFDWVVERPFTVASGLMGGRFVTSAPPGGRNLKMVAAVESEGDFQAMHEILRRPLVLISPSDASEVWAVPVTESMRVIKVGRIRQITAEFIGTGPQPVPQLADVG